MPMLLGLDIQIDHGMNIDLKRFAVSCDYWSAPVSHKTGHIFVDCMINDTYFMEEVWCRGRVLFVDGVWSR